MSLKRGDWAKIIGGLALGATGLGLAGVSPFAGLIGSSGAAGAAGAGGAGAGAAAGGTSLGKVLAPSLIGTGLSTTMSGAAGTPSSMMTTPSGVPQMDDPPDPMALFEALKKMKRQGGLS